MHYQISIKTNQTKIKFWPINDNIFKFLQFHNMKFYKNLIDNIVSYNKIIWYTYKADVAKSS